MTYRRESIRVIEKVFQDELHDTSDLKSIEQVVNDLCSENKSLSIRVDLDEWKKRSETEMEL